MKSIAKTTVETVLTLNEDEARWLRKVMQNPIFTASPEDEDPTDALYRRMFFKAVEDITPY